MATTSDPECPPLAERRAAPPIEGYCTAGARVPASTYAVIVDYATEQGMSISQVIRRGLAAIVPGVQVRDLG